MARQGRHGQATIWHDRVAGGVSVCRAGVRKVRDYYRALKRNEIQIVDGNKQAAEAAGDGKTGNGEIFIGVTDTDDAMDQIKDGKHVVLIFPDRDAPKDSKLGTLFLPNTLSIIKGTHHPEEAKKLVDYLLSAKIEEKLAASDSHQIPLNPQAKGNLPKEMAGLDTVKCMDVDFYEAAKLWDEVQKFLLDEFAR